jgi:hypothetical protein
MTYDSGGKSEPIYMDNNNYVKQLQISFIIFFQIFNQFHSIKIIKSSFQIRFR